MRDMKRRKGEREKKQEKADQPPGEEKKNDKRWRTTYDLGWLIE